ncbi:MAG TPA: hypothetical protein VJC18_05000 [bacterium]|nr:hypothetical protein [bacterium]
MTTRYVTIGNTTLAKWETEFDSGRKGSDSCVDDTGLDDNSDKNVVAITLGDEVFEKKVGDYYTKKPVADEPSMADIQNLLNAMTCQGATCNKFVLPLQESQKNNFETLFGEAIVSKAPYATNANIYKVELDFGDSVDNTELQALINFRLQMAANQSPQQIATNLGPDIANLYLYAQEQVTANAEKPQIFSRGVFDGPINMQWINPYMQRTQIDKLFAPGEYANWMSGNYTWFNGNDLTERDFDNIIHINDPTRVSHLTDRDRIANNENDLGILVSYMQTAKEHLKKNAKVNYVNNPVAGVTYANFFYEKDPTTKKGSAVLYYVNAENKWTRRSIRLDDGNQTWFTSSTAEKVTPTEIEQALWKMFVGD